MLSTAHRILDGVPEIRPSKSGKTNQKGIAVSLKPGDMLFYKGSELEHWRKPFKGNSCCQVFLHYNNVNGNFKNKYKYDGRPMLGLPAYIKIKNVD